MDPFALFAIVILTLISAALAYGVYVLSTLRRLGYVIAAGLPLFVAFLFAGRILFWAVPASLFLYYLYCQYLYIRKRQ